MMKSLLCFSLCVVIALSEGVSTKMDFPEEPIYVTNMNANNTEDEDVEVKHTIVVSTKLKNNNRRGITNNGHGDGALTYNIGQNREKEDSGEVPVIKSYKTVETTQIRTPDTRYKSNIYPDSIFVNRNIRDEGDIYPNVVVNPLNWKPASFYNNVNYYPENAMNPYGISRRRNHQNPGKVHRKLSDDGVREFYCNKCTELSRGQGLRGCGGQVVQQRSANAWAPIVPYETTTPKMKIDGKLAKLN